MLQQFSPFCELQFNYTNIAETKIPCETLGQQLELIEIWSVFLTWDILFARITSKDIQFYPYQL